MDNIASKRMRTSLSSSNAAKVFAESEEKMELFRWKGQAKMLETKVSALERELEEKEALLSDTERQQQGLAKNTLDARISALERELSYLMDRERQALQRASNAEKQLFEERGRAEAKLRKVSEERRMAEQEITEQCDRLRAENQEYHAAYMEERRKATQLSHDCSQHRLEVGSLTRRNEELIEQISSATKQCWDLRTSNQKLQDEMTRFREECSVAMAMRDDLLKFKALQQENSALKKQVEKYKNSSENTLLLKEQNMSLEEQIRRLQIIQQQLADENNELKAAIAKPSLEPTGQSLALSDMDQLSRHCLDLRNDNSVLEQEIQRLNGELQEKMSVIEQYESALENQMSEAEVALAEKEEIIQSKNSRCMELENLIEKREATIDQFENALRQMDAEYKRVVEENECLQKRLSPLEVSAASQMEGFVDPGSAEEYSKTLKEKEARIDYLETRCGFKLDYDPATTRVIHMDDNPLSTAQKERADRVKEVESENHRLRIRVEELERLRQRVVSQPEEPMDEDVTSKVAMRLDVEQLDAERKALIEKLRKSEEENQKQKERMKEAHQHLAKEFREVCAMLTGFHLKMKEGGLYVVQSIYDKARENYFLVKKGEGSKLDLLHNEYTPRWMDFAEMYLMTDHSFPAFLAAVTLNLYEKEKETTHDAGLEGTASTSSS